MMETCGSRPRRPSCWAALGLLLLSPLILSIGDRSFPWLQQHQQSQQPRQQRDQLHEQQESRGLQHNREAVAFPAWILLTAEATRQYARLQGAAAASGAAKDSETTAAAQSERVDGTSRSAEVHAEQQQRDVSAGGQQQGIQKESASQQLHQQEAAAGDLSSSQEVTGDKPTSTVLPVALPPASHFEALDGAVSSPPAAASPAVSATVLPSRVSSADARGAPLREEATAGSTASAAAVVAGEPRHGSTTTTQQQQQLLQMAGRESAEAAAPGGRPSDSAAVVTRAAGGQTEGAAAGHAGLLWMLLWPAAAFPVWVLGRMSWLLKVLAVVAAAVMQLAPLPTALRVRAQRSTGEVEGLPFLMLLFSASLWLMYGLLKLDLVLLLPNVTGVLLSCWYLHIFMRYCGGPPKDVSIDYHSSMDSSARWDEVVEHMHQSARRRKQRTQIYGYSAGCLLVACGIFVASAAGLARPAHIVGLTAAVVNVLTYAAPLAALRRVLRTRSTACMPVEVSVGNWICSCLWLVYGWLSADLFILMPNLLGTVVGLLQVGLLVKFPASSGRHFASIDGCCGDDVCSPSSHLGTSTADAGGVAYRPCAESSYLLSAADTAAVHGDTAAEMPPKTCPALGAAAPACAAPLPPTAASVDSQRVFLAGGSSMLHADAESLSSNCGGGPPPSHQSTSPQTAGVVAYRQQPSAHDFDTVKLIAGGSHSNSTNCYGSSTRDNRSSTSICGSRLCSPVVNYGGKVCDPSSTTTSTTFVNQSMGSRSDCGVGSGGTRAAVDFVINERSTGKHTSGTAYDESLCIRNSTSRVVTSTSGISQSVCGINAPSLPTHEMLLRDWQLRLAE